VLAQHLSQYLAWQQANHADPIIGPALKARGVTLESVQQQLMSTLNQPGGLQKAIMQYLMTNPTAVLHELVSEALSYEAKQLL
jgi:hypothetical protein